jgi:selenocysteine-specific elongation factor
MLARLEGAAAIIAKGPYVAHRDFRPALSPEDAELLERLVKEVAAARFDPPAWTGLKTTASLSKQRAKTLADMIKTEPRLVMFEPQHYIAAEAIEAFKETVTKLANESTKGVFKLADVRDALGLSRRAVQPLLEYLDRIGYTKRVGDERMLLERPR